MKQLPKQIIIHINGNDNTINMPDSTKKESSFFKKMIRKFVELVIKI